MRRLAAVSSSIGAAGSEALSAVVLGSISATPCAQAVRHFLVSLPSAWPSLIAEDEIDPELHEALCLLRHLGAQLAANCDSMASLGARLEAGIDGI